MSGLGFTMCAAASWALGASRGASDGKVRDRLFGAGTNGLQFGGMLIAVGWAIRRIEIGHERAEQLNAANAAMIKTDLSEAVEMVNDMLSLLTARVSDAQTALGAAVEIGRQMQRGEMPGVNSIIKEHDR